METPEQVLRRLEFKVIRRLDGFFFGEYTGLFYGPSLDLAEVREYQPGDEVRRIDWNVTARMDRLFVRQYREEREITGWLLVDRSPSMEFGTRRRFKADLATEFAGVAAYLMTRHGDKVGLLTFPDRRLLPPRTGRRHVLRILDILGQPARPALPEKGQERERSRQLGDFLREAARLFRRRALLFLVSDFLDSGDWGSALLELSRRHDVIAVWIIDPVERELPDVGGLTLKDPETGAMVWVDTSDPAVREAYRNAVAAQETAISDVFRRSGVDVLQLVTSESLLHPLIHFINYRKGRRPVPASRLRAG
ncbi:MAG: DUF58 domain-containing protein [Armatimonadota bacterium]|nr:DUF58 domain-containing protein [Armatimonadota bacterium]MDR5703448.1 DUF58 domain-containing protein [Armatimonadota bacterium]MDR7434359.1 DUF58 domain-containing protein [Armatimonadota bacterium]